MSVALPEDRRGQALAAGLLALVAALVWLVVVAPVLGWYTDRAEQLAARTTLARRMASVTASLPDLRRQVTQAASGDAQGPSTLKGATDGVAAASLQEMVQAMAAQAGATLTSQETLAADAVGAHRRISLRVSLTAPYAVLVALLRDIDAASPRLLVDDLHLTASLLVGRQAGAPMEASFTVIGFRAATTDASL